MVISWRWPQQKKADLSPAIHFGKMGVVFFGGEEMGKHWGITSKTEDEQPAMIEEHGDNTGI